MVFAGGVGKGRRGGGRRPCGVALTTHDAWHFAAVS